MLECSYDMVFVIRVNVNLRVEVNARSVCSWFKYGSFAILLTTASGVILKFNRPCCFSLLS